MARKQDYTPLSLDSKTIEQNKFANSIGKSPYMSPARDRNSGLRLQTQTNFVESLPAGAMKLGNQTTKASLSNGFAQSKVNFDNVGNYLGAITDKAHNNFWGAIIKEDTRNYKMQSEMEKLAKRKRN